MSSTFPSPIPPFESLLHYFLFFTSFIHIEHGDMFVGTLVSNDTKARGFAFCRPPSLPFQLIMSFLPNVSFYVKVKKG
jgi:hypothetical protein